MANILGYGEPEDWGSETGAFVPLPTLNNVTGGQSWFDSIGSKLGKVLNFALDVKAAQWAANQNATVNAQGIDGSRNGAAGVVDSVGSTQLMILGGVALLAVVLLARR